MSHSYYDIPFDENIGKKWYKNGLVHRRDLPAIENFGGRCDCDMVFAEYAGGIKLWYINGKLHRDYDLPAVEHICGTKEWYQYGRLHRDNDLPAIEEKEYKARYIRGEKVRDCYS